MASSTAICQNPAKAPRMADDDSLAHRLRRLEDLEEIRQLFTDYGRHLDAGDVHAYAALFADEGEVLLGPIGRAKGPAAIAELMTKVKARATTASFHLITNPVIRLDGDRATSQVLWTVIRPDATGKLEVAMFGRHDDELIRERGRWRFLKRKGRMDVPAAVAPPR
jgi:uncharacterized protein (TIGR02246 family)